MFTHLALHLVRFAAPNIGRIRHHQIKLLAFEGLQQIALQRSHLHAESRHIFPRHFERHCGYIDRGHLRAWKRMRDGYRNAS